MQFMICLGKQRVLRIGGALLAVNAALAVPVAIATGGTQASMVAPLVAKVNSQTFADPAGDAQGTAPDVTAIRVDNDDRGVITFHVAIANRAQLGAEDLVVTDLDTDNDLNTGCAGFEYGVVARGSAVTILHCVAGHLDPRTPQGRLKGGFDPTAHEVRFSLPRFDIQNTGGFRIVVVADSENQKWFDSAGEAEPWIYQVIAPPDVTAPRVKASAGSGRHGSKAALVFALWDDSGWARIKVKVFRGKKAIFTTKGALQQFDDGYRYSLPWRVPRGVRGTLRFCVQAWDYVGNGSAPGCARLTIR
jgi:hypothetical protein